MVFPSEAAWQTVVDFNLSPSTPEKDAISKRYLEDEVSTYEFVSLAKEYMDKINVK